MANEESNKEMREKCESVAEAIGKMLEGKVPAGDDVVVHNVCDDNICMLVVNVGSGEGANRKTTWSVMIPFAGFTFPSEPYVGRAPAKGPAKKAHKELTDALMGDIRALYELVRG